MRGAISLTAVELGREDLDDLAQALAAEGMPADDLAGPDKRFFAFDDRERGRIGFGGVEVHGGEGLLRSVVTVQGMRGRGYGRAMVEWLVREAARSGVRRLYLLTMDAAGFFGRYGFTATDRGAVPPVIARTEQFATLCPASAVCMVRELS